jgi:hypothetical protein
MQPGDSPTTAILCEAPGERWLGDTAAASASAASDAADADNPETCNDDDTIASNEEEEQARRSRRVAAKRRKTLQIELEAVICTLHVLEFMGFGDDTRFKADIATHVAAAHRRFAEGCGGGCG